MTSGELQKSLDNALKSRLSAFVSPEYASSWGSWVMPLGPPISRLRASARPISDSVSTGSLTGWATPRATDGDKNVRSPEGALREAQRKGGNNDLGTTAQLTGWPTPKANDSYSPHVRAPGKERPVGQWNLTTVAQLTGWATPTAGDWRSDRNQKGEEQWGKKGRPLARQAQWTSPDGGTTTTSSTAPTGKRAGLNPVFVCWLLGYPATWVSYARSGTRLSSR